jgi:hypothetical protein
MIKSRLINLPFLVDSPPQRRGGLFACVLRIPPSVSQDRLESTRIIVVLLDSSTPSRENILHLFIMPC